MEIDGETYLRENSITKSMEIALMSELRIDRNQFLKDLDILKSLNEAGDMVGLLKHIEEMKKKYD